MSTYTFGANVMLKRPVASAYLAGVSNAWATLETSLADLVDFLVSNRDLSNVYKSDPLGMELFRSLQTFNLRWESLLKASLKARLKPADYASIEKRLNKLRETIREAGKYRNDLVHSIYGIDESYDDNENLVKSKPYTVLKPSGPHELVNDLYLRDVMVLIQNARTELSLFARDVRAMAQANRP